MVLSSVFIALMLCIVRMTGMFVIMPIFGSKNAPVLMKVGMVFFTSYAILPLLDLQYVQSVDSFLELSSLIVVEFIIGFVLGLVTTMVLSCIYVAGTIIDRNIGFGMVNVINPVGNEQVPITANFLNLMALMIFFITNGHHRLIRALVESFNFAPVGRGTLNILVALKFSEILQTSFMLGFKLASPFIVTVFVANLLLGLLAKAMPGMNVFMIGMPFKILIGFILFIVLIPYYYAAFVEVFEWIWNLIENIMIYLS